jgi:hypothetical protein
MLVREYRRAKEAISKFAVHDCRGAVRNPVSLVGVKNCDVECGETGFLESRYYFGISTRITI